MGNVSYGRNGNRLQSSGLLADVSIGIREGRSATSLKPGGELAAEGGADVFAAMNDLAAQVTDLTRTQISPLIATFSQRLDSITGAIDHALLALSRSGRLQEIYLRYFPVNLYGG